MRRNLPVLVFLVLFLAALGFAGFYFLINEKPELIPRPLKSLVMQADLLENPPSTRCGECHQKIFAAWKDSRHFVSWTSENYIKDSEERSKEKCLPCHVPKEVNPGNKPSPRLERRDEGVYCVSCHVRDGAVNGPYDLYSPPHPTREDENFRRSKFCGSCHEKTYKEWLASDQVYTCQFCHMPRAEGRLVDNMPLKFLHEIKDVADHSFPHGELGENEIRLKVEFKNNKVRIILSNDTIPHQVPTADNGDPRLYLTTLQYDKQGQLLDKNREILAPQQESGLQYRKPAWFEYRIWEGASKLTVDIQYRPAWSKEKSSVLNKSYDILN